jgi:hypothetical protein
MLKISKVESIVVSYANEEDYVIYVVRSGHRNTSNKKEFMFYVFTEDAYRMEPFQSGVELLTSEELKIKYNISADQHFTNEQV